jgi:hypothetical protein
MRISVSLQSRTVGRTPRTGDQLVARTLPVHILYTTQTLNIHILSGIQTYGPGVSVSEDTSSLDHSATVTGR